MGSKSEIVKRKCGTPMAQPMGWDQWKLGTTAARPMFTNDNLKKKSQGIITTMKCTRYVPDGQQRLPTPCRAVPTANGQHAGPSQAQSPRLPTSRHPPPASPGVRACPCLAASLVRRPVHQQHAAHGGAKGDDGGPGAHLVEARPLDQQLAGCRLLLPADHFLPGLPATTATGDSRIALSTGFISTRVQACGAGRRAGARRVSARRAAGPSRSPCTLRVLLQTHDSDAAARS